MFGATGKYDAGFKSWMREFKLTQCFFVMGQRWCWTLYVDMDVEQSGRFIDQPDSAPPISSPSVVFCHHDFKCQIIPAGTESQQLSFVFLVFLVAVCNTAPRGF